MKAIKYCFCAALLCVFSQAKPLSNRTKQSDIFTIDTKQLIIDTQYLKPFFENNNVGRLAKISFDKFIAKLIKLSIYYDEIVAMYKLDKLESQKSTILFLNKILLPIQLFAREKDPDEPAPNQELLDKIEQLNTNQQLLDRIDEIADKDASRQRWKRVKIIAICITAIIVVAAICVGSYIIYKKVTTLFEDEENQQFEYIEKINARMQHKLNSFKRDIQKVKKNNQQIKQSLITGKQKIDSTKELIEKTKQKQNQIIEDKKIITEITKNIVELEKKFELLKATDKFKLKINQQWAKQFNDQAKTIVELKRKIKQLQQQANYADERYDLHFDSELHLTKITLEEKVKNIGVKTSARNSSLRSKKNQKEIEKIKEALKQGRKYYDSFSDDPSSNKKSKTKPRKKRNKKRKTKKKK